MKVALGQFAVSSDVDVNIATCRTLIRQAQARGADLLVLPEGVLARDIADPDMVLKAAQPLDGPFIEALLPETCNGPVVMLCIHVPVPDHAKVSNVLVVLRDGAVVAQYRKLHLYDAFSVQESRHVEPGDSVPPLLEIAGFKVGLMTCYDLRFPELARRLALDGADVLVAPSAWLRGPLKEDHWDLVTRARALDNTVYLVAADECGPRNIGKSIVVDPLGVPVVQAAEGPALLFAELSTERLAQARASLPVLQNRRFARPELSGQT